MPERLSTSSSIVDASRDFAEPARNVPIAPSRPAANAPRPPVSRSLNVIDGDMVVVQKNAPTRVGDIVVAVVDGQVTVKYLRQQPDGRFYLQPANAAFADILPVGELEILGVVVGSFRSYRR